MPYAPTDRFALTAKGVAALAAREQVKDCRAILPEHEPPCGACDACRELYGDDDGEEGGPAVDLAGCYGGEEFRGDARYSGALSPADDADVIPFP